ncbi:hypothetical protein [Roseovarius marisflavi]|nr:hypothetical protein [Roseovarius marisflavi]
MPAPIIPTRTTVFFKFQCLSVATLRRSSAKTSGFSLNDVILGKRPVISWEKEYTKQAEGPMVRLIKWLFYLAILGFIALVAYSYLGPFFGADFSPPQDEIRQEIILETN